MLTKFLERLKDKYDITNAWQLMDIIELGIAQSGKVINEIDKRHILQKLCECVFEEKYAIERLADMVGSL